jgi:hypothetical protein
VAAQPSSFFQIHCGGINTSEQYETILSLFSREVNPLGVVHFIAALILEFEGRIMQVPLFCVDCTIPLSGFTGLSVL